MYAVELTEEQRSLLLELIRTEQTNPSGQYTAQELEEIEELLD